MMGRTCNTEIINAHIMVGKPHPIKLSGRPGLIWEDNIKIKIR
jgi:hypothetical protein